MLPATSRNKHYCLSPFYTISGCFDLAVSLSSLVSNETWTSDMLYLQGPPLMEKTRNIRQTTRCGERMWRYQDKINRLDEDESAPHQGVKPWLDIEADSTRLPLWHAATQYASTEACCYWAIILINSHASDALKTRKHDRTRNLPNGSLWSSTVCQRQTHCLFPCHREYIWWYLAYIHTHSYMVCAWHQISDKIIINECITYTLCYKFLITWHVFGWGWKIIETCSKCFIMNYWKVSNLTRITVIITIVKRKGCLHYLQSFFPLKKHLRGNNLFPVDGVT